MSDEPQNPTPAEPSIPPSPQEPTADAPIPATVSTPAEVPSGATEASREGFSDESNNIPPSNSTHIEPEKEAENKDQNESVPEPQPEAEQPPAEIQPLETAPEAETPQIPVNEPLPESEPSVSEAEEEPKPIETPEPEPEKEKPKISYLKSQKAKELLMMARNAMQFRKRKKLDRVMSLFLEKAKITNDEVEKLLHVSDATATRYLSQLEKEGKIKQNGRTGAGVSYSRI